MKTLILILALAGFLSASNCDRDLELYNSKMIEVIMYANTKDAPNTIKSLMSAKEVSDVILNSCRDSLDQYTFNGISKQNSEILDLIEIVKDGSN